MVPWIIWEAVKTIPYRVFYLTSLISDWYFYISKIISFYPGGHEIGWQKLVNDFTKEENSSPKHIFID